MSLDYLEQLENQINRGKPKYACPGPNSNEWFFADTIDELRQKAQRTADAKRLDTQIFKLVNKMETVSGDSYLVVRKVLEPGPRGEPHFQWSLVDTREAADMLRDVSHGPTPFFGAVVEENFKPK